MYPQDQQPGVQPPVMQQPVLSPMPDTKPKSRRKLWIILAVVAVLVLGPVAYSLVANMLGKSGGVSYSKEGDADLGTLKVGAFNYINACDVFNAGDLDVVTGKVSNRMQVGARYAMATDEQGDPQRTYRSECRRATFGGLLAGDYVLVSVTQYSHKGVQEKMTELEKHRSLPALTEYTEDPTLAAKFGAEAKPVYANNTLYLTIDNKEITIKTFLVADKDKSEAWALAIGEAVKKRIAEVSAAPSKAPEYSASGVTVGSFPYQNACSLWGPQDFESLFGTEADPGEIGADIAEITQEVTGNVLSSCAIGEKPPKTDLNSGNITDLTGEKSVVVEADQYVSTSRAASAFETAAGDGTAVGGLGEKAAIAVASHELTGSVNTLYILQGNVVYSVQIGSPEGNVISDPAQLQTIGSTVLSRVQ